MTLLINLVYILIGLAGLYFGGEWLVTGASRLALAFNVSPMFIGLTIVAIGTSTPELVVSILAALDGAPGLALGNVIGSNIANIGLILGLTGTLRVLSVHEKLVRREIPVLITVTFLAILLMLDGALNRLDGIILLIGFVVFTALFYYFARGDGVEPDLAGDIDLPEISESGKVKVNRLAEFTRIVLGIALLVIGARLMVIGARNFALAIGVSDLVIGLTVVAVGTSLPELATSLTAAFKGENDIAVGNIIGSNVANLLLVLGATSATTTIDIAKTHISIVEYVVMVGFTLLLLPFARNRQLSRLESALFLGGYLIFVLYSFVLSPG